MNRSKSVNWVSAEEIPTSGIIPARNVNLASSIRQLVDSVIAYQKENAQLADVIENFIAAQGTSKEDDAYTALCAYPKNLNKQSYE
jgi:hypothetical protein